MQDLDGLVMAGFKVSESDRKIVIRDPATGKETELAKDKLDWIRQNQMSVMPAGLVNQLKGREQFLDLLRFLIDVNEGGPERMNALKKAAGGN